MEAWVIWFLAIVAFILGFVCGAIWMRGELYCAVPFRIEKRGRRTK